MCDDDVVDYLIMEAVAVKVRKEERDQERKDEQREWKNDRSKLKKYG